MTGRWIIRFPAGQRAALASCRLVPGLEVAEEVATDSRSGLVWVRGAELKDAERRMLRAIPRAEWFDIDSESRLRQEGRRLASGPLPPLTWRPIIDAVPLTLPRAGFAGTPLRPAGLELARSSDPRKPNLLLTTRDEWSRYGETAPRIRLEAWRFAADRAGRVLVRGLPLPPLPGTPFVEEDGIAVPAGWAFAPSLPSVVVREVLAIPRGDVALFAPDGTWEQIAADDFVPATRAALRSVDGEEVGP